MVWCIPEYKYKYKFIQMHEIEGINFSIWGANDILRESVVHITEKKTVENGVFVEN